MLTHHEIWSAIDRIAAAQGITVSALARRSGLDPTSFNKSKRATRDGKPRWPSTESIAKVLTATDCTLSAFVDFVMGVEPRPARPRRMIPLLGYAQAGRDGHFDDSGYPTGVGWEQIELPALGDDDLFALRVVGDSMEPLYRESDIIVVSPAAPVSRGDRVVLRTKGGEVMAKQLRRRSASEIELASINPAYPDVTLPRGEVAWIWRIVWASQ